MCILLLLDEGSLKLIASETTVVILDVYRRSRFYLQSSYVIWICFTMNYIFEKKKMFNLLFLITSLIYFQVSYINATHLIKRYKELPLNILLSF